MVSILEREIESCVFVFRSVSTFVVISPFLCVTITFMYVTERGSVTILNDTYNKKSCFHKKGYIFIAVVCAFFITFSLLECIDNINTGTS